MYDSPTQKPGNGTTAPKTGDVNPVIPAVAAIAAVLLAAGGVLTMLQYKGEFYGKTVVLVPPAYTTQTCSCCGHVLKGEFSLTLKDREWVCPVCHAFHDRDTNAARNILAKGLQLAETCGPSL